MAMTKAGWIKRKLNGNGTAWNKGKKVPQQSGVNNPKWKGDKVSHSALHHWLYRHLGKPDYCIFDKTHEGRYEWANISHVYKRDLKDYMSLCKFCHRKYDYRKDSNVGKNIELNPLFFNRWTNTWEKRKKSA